MLLFDDRGCFGLSRGRFEDRCRLEVPLCELRGLGLLKEPEIEIEFCLLRVGDYSVVRRVVAWWWWRESANWDECWVIHHSAFGGWRIYIRKLNLKVETIIISDII